MGHPILKKEAELFTRNEITAQDTQKLLIDLYDTMKNSQGIGIAAPQIGVSKQVCLIELPANSERYGNLPQTELMIIFNPTIEFLTNDKQSFYEGCLSVPGLRGKVSRPKKIKVKYIDSKNIEKEIIAEDFLATVFQHEIDHLFGKLYVEQMEDLSSLSFTEEYDEFMKDS
jgi:peptide deformylase